jgi:hypothetical protein
VRRRLDATAGDGRATGRLARQTQGGRGVVLGMLTSVLVIELERLDLVQSIGRVLVDLNLGRMWIPQRAQAQGHAGERKPGQRSSA